MDYVADVKKYTDAVDEEVVESLAKTYRLVLSKTDSAAVAYGDPAELETVKKNFLINKLGLSDADGLDEAIAAVGAKMQGVRTKNRLTVYYLLAEHLGKLDALK